MILPANVLRPVKSYLEADDYLKYASIPRGITVHDEVTLALKEGFHISKLPKDISMQSAYGTYDLTFTTDSEKLIIRRSIQFRKGRYTKNEYNSFKEFLDSIKKSDLQNIVLNLKT